MRPTIGSWRIVFNVITSNFGVFRCHGLCRVGSFWGPFWVHILGVWGPNRGPNPGYGVQKGSNLRSNLRSLVGICWIVFNVITSNFGYFRCSISRHIGPFWGPFWGPLGVPTRGQGSDPGSDPGSRGPILGLGPIPSHPI